MQVNLTNLILLVVGVWSVLQTLSLLCLFVIMILKDKLLFNKRREIFDFIIGEYESIYAGLSLIRYGEGWKNPHLKTKTLYLRLSRVKKMEKVWRDTDYLFIYDIIAPSFLKLFFMPFRTIYITPKVLAIIKRLSRELKKCEEDIAEYKQLFSNSK